MDGASHQMGVRVGFVTPLPPPGRREGARHGTETHLPDFLTLVGPFQ